jgi:N-acetylneuraminic acid mutarotase
MKIIFLLLFVSCSSYADFVYMKETESAKTIQLFSGSKSETINDITRQEWALYPDISADGKEVVYAEGKGPQGLHLTIQRLADKSSKRFLSPQPGMILHPKFTKNGKLVFFSGPGPSGKNTILFFDPKKIEDLSQAQVLDAAEESYFPRPSSDAGFVVYQRNTNGKKEIVLFDRIENQKKVIAEGMSPALSFDERQIAYTSKQSGSWDVYVYDRMTNQSTRMTNDSHDEMAPTFKADNSLVFASNRSGHFRLMHLKGNREAAIELEAEGEWDAYAPQFSGEADFKQGERASYPGKERSSFGTVQHDGKIYMCGGHQGAEHTYPPESFSDEFVVYDIASNTWSSLAPRPLKAHGYQIAASGNYVYAFGGFVYSADHKPKWKSVPFIDRYDIRLNKWERIGELNLPRSSNVAATIDDKVYIVGGWDSTPQKPNDAEGRFQDSVEIFDLKTEKVTLAPFKMPAPLRRALTGAVYNGKILLVGGLGIGASHFELVQRVTSIDPETGVATELAPLPFATFAPAAEVMGDTLYVFGGMFKTGEMNYEYVSHIYAMDLKKQEWRHTGRYLQETKGFSQVFHLSDKEIGILGGHRYFEGMDSPVRTFETFR